MRWPWVRRALWEAAENLRVDANARLAASEVARQQIIEASEWAAGVSAKRIAELEAERKMLLDRVVQLSGQPALYQRTENREQRSEAQAEQPAMPRPRMTIADIHDEFSRAQKSGTLGIVAARAS